MVALQEWTAPWLELGFHKVLDLSGDELAQPIDVFRPLYRAAKSKGMRLKAHVGEWGTADDVRRAARTEMWCSSATVDGDISASYKPLRTVCISRSRRRWPPAQSCGAGPSDPHAYECRKYLWMTR